jgi:hypothetical protein
MLVRTERLANVARDASLHAKALTRTPPNADDARGDEWLTPRGAWQAEGYPPRSPVASSNWPISRPSASPVYAWIAPVRSTISDARV